jgi:hypothetical protein
MIATTSFASNSRFGGDLGEVAPLTEPTLGKLLRVGVSIGGSITPALAAPKFAQRIRLLDLEAAYFHWCAECYA